VRIARAVAWALLASMAVLMVAGLALWGEGYRLYAVRTGSMTPTYPTGSLVVDRPASADRLRTGTVITFRIGSQLVTHRVTGTGADGLHTQGDANRSADPWTLPVRNVVGEVVGGLSHGGYLLVFLRQPTGVPSLVLLVVSVLLAWQVFFGSPAGDGRADDRPDGPPARNSQPAGAALPTAVVVAIAVGLVAAAGGASVGVGSTGAYFSDSVAGAMSFDPTCPDTHEHGSGPATGNGHQTCHGKGHTKDRTDQQVVLDVTE